MVKRRADNIMAKRRRDKIMAKRRTDNTMAKSVKITKGAIRRSKSKKDRQYNGQKCEDNKGGNQKQ